MKTIQILSLAAAISLHAATLPAQSAPWKTDGNAGMPQGSFIGTTDPVPLELRTGNTEQMTIDASGRITLRTLAGTGTAIVAANPNGTLIRATDPAMDSLFDCTVKLWKANGNFITPDCFIGSTNQQPLRMHTHNQERMRITDSGKIGIATPTVKGQFQVGDYIPLVLDQHTVSPSDWHRMIGMNAYLVNGNPHYLASGPAAYMGMSAGFTDLSLCVAPSGQGGQALPFSPMLAIDQNGSIGIGTRDQGALLHLYKAGTADMRIQSGDPNGNAAIQLWAGAQGGGNEWQQARISATHSPNTGGMLQLSVNPASGPTATQVQLEIDKARAKFTSTVGIGMEPTANERLAVDGAIRITQFGTPSNQVRIGHDGTHAFLDYQTQIVNSSAPTKLIINGSGERTEFGGDVVLTGDVGIGTTSFDDAANGKHYRLSIDGKIRCREVKVNTTWADYVFEEGYPLMPLAEVEAYIQAHGHLPGIPSAQEVEAEGIELGQIQAAMMAKIEELTLHLIRLEKENRLLGEANAEMKATIISLKH